MEKVMLYNSFIKIERVNDIFIVLNPLKHNQGDIQVFFLHVVKTFIARHLFFTINEKPLGNKQFYSNKNAIFSFVDQYIF